MKSSMAPICFGCEQRMSVEDVPWFVAHPTAGGYALFCPDCEWRVGEYAANKLAEVVRLEDNRPGTVFRALGLRP